MREPSPGWFFRPVILNTEPSPIREPAADSRNGHLNIETASMSLLSLAFFVLSLSPFLFSPSLLALLSLFFSSFSIPLSSFSPSPILSSFYVITCVSFISYCFLPQSSPCLFSYFQTFSSSFLLSYFFLSLFSSLSPFCCSLSSFFYSIFPFFGHIYV